MSPSEPAIDFTQIEFPSDRLTVKELRKAIPHSFDLPAREHHVRTPQGFLRRESLENYLGGIISTEREIAAIAFYEAMGVPKPENVPGPRSTAIEALMNDYVAIGLIHGQHEGQELIRHIESQAVVQARHFQGASPPR